MAPRSPGLPLSTAPPVSRTRLASTRSVLYPLSRTSTTTRRWFRLSPSPTGRVLLGSIRCPPRRRRCLLRLLSPRHRLWFRPRRPRRRLRPRPPPPRPPHQPPPPPPRRPRLP